jgi:hypothetical protein
MNNPYSGVYMFVPVCNITGKVIKPNEDAWCCLIQVQKSFIKRQTGIYYPTELILPVTPFFKTVINDGIVYSNKTHAFTDALLKNLISNRRLRQYVAKSQRSGVIKELQFAENKQVKLKLNIFGEQLVHFSSATNMSINTSMLFISDEAYSLLTADVDKYATINKSLEDCIEHHCELYHELGSYSDDILEASATKAALNKYISTRILNCHPDTVDLCADLYDSFKLEINNLLLLLDSMVLLNISFSVPTVRNLLELKHPDSIKLQAKLAQLIRKE